MHEPECKESFLDKWWMDGGFLRRTFTLLNPLLICEGENYIIIMPLLIFFFWHTTADPTDELLALAGFCSLLLAYAYVKWPLYKEQNTNLHNTRLTTMLSLVQSIDLQYSLELPLQSCSTFLHRKLWTCHIAAISAS